MQNKLKVSTITPCFRMKPYLKKFLEELPKQTYFENLEVVLDHNEPDDEELAWVKDFDIKFPGKIKHIIVPKVDPIGTSMNRCIKESAGDLLTIWNVDDLRSPTSIESQVKSILENDSDIAIGDYKIVRHFGGTEGKTVKHSHIPTSEYKRSMVFGPFVMFKKNLCEKAGYFDEQLKSGADFDFSIRLAYHGKVSIAGDMIGYYLNEGKGASTRPNSRQPAERTVIELRYGIFDKIDLSYIPRIVEYSIPNIKSFGQNYHVKDFIENYETIISENEKKIHRSVFKTAIFSSTNFNKLKYFIKTKIKNILWKSTKQ